MDEEDEDCLLLHAGGLASESVQCLRGTKAAQFNCLLLKLPLFSFLMSRKHTYDVSNRLIKFYVIFHKKPALVLCNFLPGIPQKCLVSTCSKIVQTHNGESGAFIYEYLPYT